MRFLVSAIAALTLLTAPVAATEVTTEMPQEKAVAVTNARPGNVRGQVFKWYYRTYKGREQMRLWSLTEGKWMTDWIDCK